MPTTERWAPPLLSILRIMAGLLFLSHGISKLFGVPPFPGQITPLLHVAAMLELIGGALIVIGLFTRPAAFVLSGMMAVAYFMAHAPQGFFPSANGGDAAILFCFVFLYLAAAGAGPWSVDAMRRTR